jgi:nucleoside-diphosphate-sugar epimerase
MITLTAQGAFASEFAKYYKAEVVSIRALKNEDFWKKIMEAGTIVHNASTIDCINLSDCVRINFDFSRKLTDFLVKNNPNVNLTYISSMSILDPLSDSAYADPIDMSPYAFSKYITECYCMKSKIDRFKSVRFSTLFYKDPERDGLSRLIYDAVTKREIIIYDGGAAKRDFIPLNIAAGYVKKITALRNKEKKIFNIATGKATSFAEIARLLVKNIPGLNVIDRRSKIAVQPVLHKFNTDSIRELGEIEFSLEEDIRSYINEIALS